MEETPENSVQNQKPEFPEKIIVTDDQNVDSKSEQIVKPNAEELAEPLAELAEPLQRPSDCINPGNEVYKCRFCGLTYVYLNTLKAHERVHNVEEPYKCTKCGDAFRFHSELEYHMMGHQGQKVYKCECGRGFYRYTDLLYHKHPGEDDEVAPEETPFKLQHPLKIYAEESRPYICQYCCKAYNNSRDLKFHLYSHRGERAFNVNTSTSRYLMPRMDMRHFQLSEKYF